ncbi:MAG: RecX family transcriptional regulator [Clostridia bacterium]|nr:RecX family transcriptional regulator [Clostridia bacterium]MDE6676214.1 RecX family transcriptional regulator [Clostridia bacterium]
MEITAITPQKKDKSRCNIEVDGRFYCGMKLETVMQNRLKAGDIVTGEQLSAMQLQSEKQTALDKALTHITVSMKTEKEIRDFLSRKGYLQDVSDFVVDKMKEYGYLDDALYAQQYTENAAKRKGARLIAMELKRRGVDDETAREAVSNIENSEESARRVLEKYMRSKEVNRETLKKAYAHLISKGFDYDTARSALKSLGEEDED